MKPVARGVQIRRAAKDNDFRQVLSLLRDGSLPVEGVGEHFGDFLVAVNRAGAVVGAIGMERYPDGTGLLRSAVVEAALRNSGIGSMLCGEIMKTARSSGIRRVILLTTTAEHYFARMGFLPVARSTVSGPVTQSTEFTGSCPESATCMELILK
jgi:amino-acid N-acetyltransferase